ncbi:MAG: D-alanine--D-alanine ligase family protein [Acidimicrobiales bacterium]
MTSERTRLIVVFGGRSAEHDVSCVTARHVLAAADPEKFRVEAVGITREGEWVRADSAIAELAAGVDALPDALKAVGSNFDLLPAVRDSVEGDETVVVFPLLHGPLGEDGTLQGMLELADVPYVGCGVLGSALTMDKIKAKESISYHGLAQAEWSGFHVDRIDNSSDRSATIESLIADLGLPLFVKPANMGSSIGVSKANDAQELWVALELASTYDEWIVVEEAIDGREIEIAVLGNRELQVSVPGEIEPGDQFYSYADKYHDGKAGLIIPADLNSEEVAEIQELAKRAFHALRCEGMARADFFYEKDGRGWLLNELNTIPGFTPISMYPKMWEASGLSYRDLIDELVRLALERHGRQRHRTDY